MNDLTCRSRTINTPLYTEAFCLNHTSYFAHALADGALIVQEVNMRTHTQTRVHARTYVRTHTHTHVAVCDHVRSISFVHTHRSFLVWAEQG